MLWQTHTDREELLLLRWDGTAWAGFDDSHVSGAWTAAIEAQEPSLSIDALGRPHVAYGSEVGVAERHWDGAAWTTYGELDQLDSQHCAGPAIAVAPDGSSVIAWYGDSGVVVQRWNGTAWVELPGVMSGEVPERRVSLALMPNGDPVVAWQHLANDGFVTFAYAKRWNGSRWVELGGSASGFGFCRDPRELQQTRAGDRRARAHLRSLGGGWLSTAAKQLHPSARVERQRLSRARRSCAGHRWDQQRLPERIRRADRARSPAPPDRGLVARGQWLRDGRTRLRPPLGRRELE